jgi:tRNA1Val (adenine37-N6)-methyltransferase
MNMSNNWFQFKEFKIVQENSAMKVGVDSVLFGACISFNSPIRVLDIGTGTGLLAFMALQRTGAQITAVEIEEQAYQDCLRNVKLNRREDRIEVIHTSFQDFAFQTAIRFDHIICNPPWYNNTYESTELNRNTARQNKLLSCSELINGVNRILSETGYFSLIIPIVADFDYKNEAKKRDLNCFNRILIRPTMNKIHHRVILEFSRKAVETKTGEVSIRDYKTGLYSDEYRKLTKDFYLDKRNEK